MGFARERDGVSDWATDAKLATVEGRLANLRNSMSMSLNVLQHSRSAFDLV